MKILAIIAAVMLYALPCTCTYSQHIDTTDYLILKNNDSLSTNDIPVATTEITNADSLEYSFAFCEIKKGFMIFLFGSNQYIHHYVKKRNPKNIHMHMDIFSSNASVVTKNNHTYVCTAQHCADRIPLKKLRVGGDLALIDEKSLIGPDSLNTSYIKGTVNSGLDSIWIKGFIERNDTIRKVTMVGLAKIDKRKKWAFLKMDHVYDFQGLSGSPAFNSKGEMIGVYVGWVSRRGDFFYCFSVVSLFKK